MAFDSEGNFTRMYSWEQDRLNDIGIVSDRHDEEDDNFASALNNCFCRDGRAVATGNFKMGGFKITGLANAESQGDAVNKGQLDSSASNLTTSMTTNFISKLNALMPIGDIKPSLQTANHGNWLLCNGQAVSRTTYASLFALIGINFGSGDGTTTFNVPDYRGKFLRGLGGNSAADLYTTQAEGLPNIEGTFGARGLTDSDLTTTGAFTQANMSKVTSDSYSGTQDKQFGFDASKSNAIYGASEHVTPVNQAVNWFIKALEEV